MEVQVGENVWTVKWKHEPYRAKIEYYVGRDEHNAPVLAERAKPLPRGTDCAVYMNGELMAAAHVAAFRSERNNFWNERKQMGDQFCRATGRKTALRKALSAIRPAKNPELLIECSVPREVRTAIWDEYHRQWPFDPLDLYFRALQQQVAEQDQTVDLPEEAKHGLVENPEPVPDLTAIEQAVEQVLQDEANKPPTAEA